MFRNATRNWLRFVEVGLLTGSDSHPRQQLNRPDKHQREQRITRRSLRHQRRDLRRQ